MKAIRTMAIEKNQQKFKECLQPQNLRDGTQVLKEANRIGEMNLEEKE